MSPYSIDLSISSSDVQTLQQAGMALYAMKVVACSAPASAVVWFETKNYAQQTALSWTETYSVYDTLSSMASGSTISAANVEPTSLGQVWDIVNPNSGQLQAASASVPSGMVGVYNESNAPWVVGLAQSSGPGSQATPICAYELLPHSEIVMQPEAKVLLFFGTGTGAGSIPGSYSDGLLIDLTQQSNQNVTYSVDSAWSANMGPAFTQVPAPDIPGTLNPQSSNLGRAAMDLRTKLGR